MLGGACGRVANSQPRVVVRLQGVVSVGKLGLGQERYYLEQAEERIDVVESLTGREDYYAGGGGEAPGCWCGTTAATLGLAGSVDAEQLRRLLAGVHPSTGRLLREPAPRLKVAAFDVTFSAPKSVSVLFGTSGSEVRGAVRAAHDLAVSEAVGYLERSAAAVRRGHNGTVVQQVNGFVAAAFRHRSSRAGDPQVHTHVVIANLGRGSDGRWTALDGRRLYAHATTASHLYQALLRAELTRRLGLEWTPVERAIAEVRGVPPRVLRAFSQRRTEIEASMAERGTSGPRAAEAAALATRQAKGRDVDPAQLFARWHERAAELGWSPDLARRGPACRDDIDLEKLAKELLGSDGLTQRASTFTRRDVVRGVCATLPPGAAVTADRVEHLADEILRHRDVVTVLAENSGGDSFRRADGRILRVAIEDRCYTTAELLALEQGIVVSAETGRAAGRGLAADLAGSRWNALSEEQRAMVTALTTRGDRVALVAGRAGTGKTYALAAAREAWKTAGAPVAGVAVARRAARELEHGAGIPSTSVAALLDRAASSSSRRRQRCARC